MIRLLPFVSKKIWGYENWLVSTLAPGLSLVDGNPPRPLIEALGRRHPLLVKVIQADERLSVQVHPDDVYAALHEGGPGKTECWYVLGAAPGASLVTGLKAGVTKSDVGRGAAKNRLEPLLHYEPVSAGDFVYLPAGTVHAIGKGLRLLEAQQPSDTTYRLCDWGRGRELHVEKALDVLREDRGRVLRGFSGAFNESPYFSVELCAGETDCAALDTLFVLGGEGELRGKTGAVRVRREDTLLCPAPETLRLSQGLAALKISPKPAPV
jgi:mannose-6-phosphate isomerase